MMMFVSSVFAGEPKFTPRKAFSNIGIAATASTLGFGLSVATPLSKHFTLRGGYMFSPLSFDYTYADFEPIAVQGMSFDVPPLDLTANLQSGNANIMVDWVPFRKGTGTFFITAGVVFGAGKLIEIDGQFDMSDPDIQALKQHGVIDQIEVEVGDQVVRADASGALNAALKVNGVRPYVGLGWGSAIPKRRLGFRFEAQSKIGIETERPGIGEMVEASRSEFRTELVVSVSDPAFDAEGEKRVESLVSPPVPQDVRRKSGVILNGCDFRFRRPEFREVVAEPNRSAAESPQVGVAAGQNHCRLRSCVPAVHGTFFYVRKCGIVGRADRSRKGNCKGENQRCDQVFHGVDYIIFPLQKPLFWIVRPLRLTCGRPVWYTHQKIGNWRKQKM
jgi:hypothetical protein